MKKILVLFLVFSAFMACEKDSDFFFNEEPMNSEQSEYALKAEELLNQLTPEEMELLTPEDITEFKNGPPEELRIPGNQYGSWHPVLALFECQVNDTNTTGVGQWYGFGPSTLEIDNVPIPGTGFEDGNFILTNPEQAELMGPYRAKRMNPRGHHANWQRLKGKFETGTQIFFMPRGNVQMHTYFHPSGNQPLEILVIGWANYGLASPPVPLEFEEYFSFDALYEHYMGLKSIPGAEAMYVSTFNEFWLYPTAEEGKIAAPGIGQGDWLGEGPITFVVDQALVNEFGKGRWRLYTGQGTDYQNSEYMDFCHDHYLGATGGTWPFELVGGSEAFSGYGGQGTGVWIGLGDPNAIFGNIPDPGLLPADMIDDGFSCDSYGPTECMFLCNPGPGVNTLVYIIGYRYPL
ncbi:MAG: hypothetical protein KJN59_11970 [Bacteroidia bacterium]|nr:hypothetical protein [Bacteroidia bacterium]